MGPGQRRGRQGGAQCRDAVLRPAQPDRPSWFARVGLLAALLLAAGNAQGARVLSVSPQGEVAEVRQVVLRFSEAVVAAGDALAPAPFTLQCNGQAPAADARWASDRQWLLDLREPLAAGQRCTLQAAPGFVPLSGAWQGTTRFAFSTGAPAIVSVQPTPGTRIEEDQHFLLRLNGAATPQSVQSSAWCEVQGLGERIPLRIVDGAPRAQLLRQRWRAPDDARTLLVACAQAFAPEAGVRLVWGPGITAADRDSDAPALVSRRTQRFQWTVRPRLLAEFSCERESANQPCLPLRPLVVRFNAPVPRALAAGARLQPLDAAGAPTGAAIAPRPEPDARSDTLTELRFAAPLPENTRFRLTLPETLRDDAGRALGNAGGFPLTVATGALPPLAKFAAAPFGILEAGSGPDGGALLPMTLRLVQADLAGASTGGALRFKRLGPETDDATLLRWMHRLQADHARQAESRRQPLLAAEDGVQRSELPRFDGGEPRATEVVGVPLRERGMHVVEAESRVLGRSLLAQAAPMYVRTGVLVTNLGVHFKRGRSSSLVWVTSLDRGRPVRGAAVAVNDCRGRPLWSGPTDASGLARIPRGFDDEAWSDEESERCPGRGGYFVTARAAGDLGFVFSDWQRGIEPWRFNQPLGRGSEPDRVVHTVFDRTLLRRGDTVSMKHFVREQTEAGLALPDVATLPDELRLVHVGSGTEVRLPLAWPRGARAAESRWAIPRTAALGSYDVLLQRGDRQWSAGSLRVEAFRVPLVDARLAAPAGPLVAPQTLALDAQLNAFAGGPLAGQALTLSALLRPRLPRFAGWDGFSFEAPTPPGHVEREADAEDGAGDGARLVAQRLPASTDAQGAARITIPALPALDGPAELVAELGFSDPAGEVQTVSQRLPLWPAAVVAALRVPDWTAARGEAAVSAAVLSTEGRPLAGREIEVLGRADQTLSTRRRIVGGFYAYDNRRETRELGVLCRGRSDAQGRLHCTVKLQASGQVELIARTQDDAGRTSQAAATLWAVGEGEGWFAQGDDDRIDVLPEQREVAPGQTARLQVRMPFRQASALVSVEREGVIDTRVVTLTGREPVIELPVPRVAGSDARSWAPNVYVSVLVLRGRLREAPWWSIFTWGWRDPADWWRAFRHEAADWRAPTALADLAKPAFRLGVAQLVVGRDEQRLDVSVTPVKTQAAPRETVRTSVQVLHQGRPLAGAEVAFAAVDEGLLALAPNESWNLLEGLWRTRPWGVETATAQGEVIGRRHFGRKALPPGGGGGRNPTRELFDTLALWRGTVALDAQGRATIDVPMNDSLTSFRLVAIADDGGQRFGLGSAVVRVTQDLQMLPGIAPLAREGDRFEAGFTLRNATTRAMSVRATLAGRAGEGAGGPPLAFAPQTVHLAAGAAVEVRWPVEVPAGATRIEWEAGVEESAAGATAARDRVRVVQAVLPAVPLRVTQSWLQPLEGTLALPVAPPPGALPGSGGIVVGLQPRLSGALPGLRRWFERYPYTCLEQQVSRAIALDDGAAWNALRDEITGYLDEDGLADYFPPDAARPARGSDRLTAHLLAVAQAAGRDWPAPALEAMLGGLAAFVDGRIERRFAAPRADLDVRKLAALAALARHGRAGVRQWGAIPFTPAVWPSSALLDAWTVLEALPAAPQRAARLAELQRLLRSRLQADGQALVFSTEAADDWWWLMDGADANAVRLLLAAVDAPAWRDEVPRLVGAALARQRGGAWSTTTANVWGVLALQRFGAVFEAQPVAGRSELRLAAAESSFDWSAAPDGGTASLPWPPAASAAQPAAAETLQLRHEGSGRPWLAVQTLAAVPLTEPLAAGYRLRRSVQVLQRAAEGTLSRGDILRVRLEVEALADRSWVVLSDPLPSGATVLGSGLARDSAIATRGEAAAGWPPTFVERDADAWRGYWEWLPRGRHVVEYTLRLNAAGRFGLPPTRVEAMYAPGSHGELPNAALEVRP
ncbi:MAG: alpha-2-macroglobulin [Rubrivivax sp.]|nr:alpha-2-macroglobulin [Rubrivivax sp.]